MPRPDPRAPGPGDESLFEDLPAGPARAAGRHSAAAETAIAAAKRDGYLTEVDGAALAAIRAGAWAFDEFEARRLPYGPAKLIQPYLDTLNALHMTPQARRELQGSADDALAALLDDLAQPAAEVRDPA